MLIKTRKEPLTTNDFLVGLPLIKLISMRLVFHTFFLPFCFLFLNLTGMYSQSSQRMSIEMESKRLNNNKVVKIRAEVFYKFDEQTMIMHYLYPVDYMLVTNSLGEAKVYFPAKNEVMIQQDPLYSSENDVIFSFLSSQINDMGLQGNGFILKESRRENGLMITSWIPPAHLLNQVSRVELVNENFLPIYISYFGPKGKMFKRTYFSKYNSTRNTPFPERITEIDYLSTGDSIMSLKTYSNPKFENFSGTAAFDFVIPPDAKRVTPKAIKK
jgi:hypothetical protein